MFGVVKKKKKRQQEIETVTQTKAEIFAFQRWKPNIKANEKKKSEIIHDFKW